MSMTRIFVATCILVGASLSAPNKLSSQNAKTLASPDAKTDYRFTAVTSVRELSDGQLIVADRGESYLYLLNFSKHSTQIIGRHGAGPNEYRGVGWVYPTGKDSTAFVDPLFPGGRLQILTGPRITSTVSPSRSAVAKIEGVILGADRSGSILGMTGRTPLESYVTADTVSLILVRNLIGGAGIQTELISKIKGSGSQNTCRGGARAGPPSGGKPKPCNPLATQEIGLLFPDGWIAIARTDPYRVEWRTPEARWIRGASLSAAQSPVTERDKCHAVGGFTKETLTTCNRELVDGRSWPSRMPPFLAPLARGRMVAPYSPVLFAAPEGNLLIRRAVTASSRSIHYDLIDRRGQLVSTVIVGPNEAIIGFGAEHVYTIHTDDVDLQSIRRHPW